MTLSEASWRKASRSHEDGDQCIELASIDASWRKALRSTAENDSCVEIAGASYFVALRDSKDPDGPKLIMSRGEFRNLAELLKNQVRHRGELASS